MSLLTLTYTITERTLIGFPLKIKKVAIKTTLVDPSHIISFVSYKGICCRQEIRYVLQKHNVSAKCTPPRM